MNETDTPETLAQGGVYESEGLQYGTLHKWTNRNPNLVLTAYGSSGLVFCAVMILVPVASAILCCRQKKGKADIKDKEHRYKFYDLLIAADDGISTPFLMFLYKQRPLPMELSTAFTVLGFILYLFGGNKFSLVIPLIPWMGYDILAAIFVVYLYRLRKKQTAEGSHTSFTIRRSTKMALLYNGLYTAFYGFPLGFIAKMLLIIWIFGGLSFSNCFLHLVIAYIILGIGLFIHSIYSLVLVCLNQFKGKSYPIIFAAGSLCAAVVAFLLSYGLFIMTDCVDRRSAISSVSLVCSPVYNIWVMILAPFIAPLVLLMGTIVLLSVRRGMVWRFVPEIVYSYLGCAAFFLFSFHIELISQGKQYSLNIIAGILLCIALLIVIIYNILLLCKLYKERRDKGLLGRKKTLTVGQKEALYNDVLQRTEQGDIVIKDIFSKTLRRDVREHGAADVCLICMESYTGEGKPTPGQCILTLITECTHSFHFNCLTSWLEKKNTCPICEVRVGLKDDLKAITLEELKCAMIKKKSDKTKKKSTKRDRSNSLLSESSLGTCISSSSDSESVGVAPSIVSVKIKKKHKHKHEPTFSKEDIVEEVDEEEEYKKMKKLSKKKLSKSKSSPATVTGENNDKPIPNIMIEQVDDQPTDSSESDVGSDREQPSEHRIKKLQLAVAKQALERSRSLPSGEGTQEGEGWAKPTFFIQAPPGDDQISQRSHSKSSLDHHSQRRSHSHTEISLDPGFLGHHDPDSMSHISHGSTRRHSAKIPHSRSAQDESHWPQHSFRRSHSHKERSHHDEVEGGVRPTFYIEPQSGDDKYDGMTPPSLSRQSSRRSSARSTKLEQEPSISRKSSHSEFLSPVDPEDRSEARRHSYHHPRQDIHRVDSLTPGFPADPDSVSMVSATGSHRLRRHSERGALPRNGYINSNPGGPHVEPHTHGMRQSKSSSDFRHYRNLSEAANLGNNHIEPKRKLSKSRSGSDKRLPNSPSNQSLHIPDRPAFQRSNSSPAGEHEPREFQERDLYQGHITFMGHAQPPPRSPLLSRQRNSFTGP